MSCSLWCVELLSTWLHIQPSSPFTASSFFFFLFYRLNEENQHNRLEWHLVLVSLLLYTQHWECGWHSPEPHHSPQSSLKSAHIPCQPRNTRPKTILSNRATPGCRSTPARGRSDGRKGRTRLTKQSRSRLDRTERVQRCQAARSTPWPRLVSLWFFSFSFLVVWRMALFFMSNRYNPRLDLSTLELSLELV